MKVMCLEFKKNCTLEEIKSNMEYYQKVGQVVMTEINGEEVYSNDPELDLVFERLELGLGEEEFKNLKGLERDNEVYKKRLINANDIENTEYFRFYYGLAKTMIKPDKIDSFENIINVYGRKCLNNLIIATQIMLAMENDSKIQIYKEISQIISTARLYPKDKVIDFDMVYSLVKKMAIKGDMLDEIFFKDTTLGYRNKLVRKIRVNNKRIDEIKK